VRDPTVRETIVGEQELREINRKLQYVRYHLVSRREVFGQGNAFNVALARFKKEVELDENAGTLLARGELRIVTWSHAKRAAAARGAQALSTADIAHGRREAARHLKPRKRRPSDSNLQLCVNAAMTILQEGC
jgi:hypothetical protein